MYEVALKEAYFPLLWWYLESGNFERCVECCDISINLAAKLGAPPVMYSTISPIAPLIPPGIESPRLPQPSVISREGT